MDKRIVIILLAVLLVLVSCKTQFQTYSDGTFTVSYPKFKPVNVGGPNVVVNVNNGQCAVQINKIKNGPLGFESTASILLNIAKSTGQFNLISSDISSSYANVDYKTGINNVGYQASLRARNCGEYAYAVFFACKDSVFSKYSDVMGQTFGSMNC